MTKHVNETNDPTGAAAISEVEEAIGRARAAGDADAIEMLGKVEEKIRAGKSLSEAVLDTAFELAASTLGGDGGEGDVAESSEDFSDLDDVLDAAMGEILAEEVEEDSDDDN